MADETNFDPNEKRLPPAWVPDEPDSTDADALPSSVSELFLGEYLPPLEDADESTSGADADEKAGFGGIDEAKAGLDAGVAGARIGGTKLDGTQTAGAKTAGAKTAETQAERADAAMLRGDERVSGAALPWLDRAENEAASTVDPLIRRFEAFLDKNELRFAKYRDVDALIERFLRSERLVAESPETPETPQRSDRANSPWRKLAERFYAFVPDGIADNWELPEAAQTGGPVDKAGSEDGRKHAPTAASADPRIADEPEPEPESEPEPEPASESEDRTGRDDPSKSRRSHDGGPAVC